MSIFFVFSFYGFCFPLLKSWNIDVKVEKKELPAISISTLPFSTGLWSDYDIDDQMLRSKTWGTQKRTAQ